MKFEKIAIDKKTFENIADNVHDKFMNVHEDTWLEDIKLALSEVIFDVKPSYVEGEWNSCDVVPPEEYEACDVLIRRKGLAPKDISGHTTNIDSYRLGIYFSEDSYLFSLPCLDPVFREDENPSDFEYKFIK